MGRSRLAGIALVIAFAMTACSRGTDSIVVGAMYPTHGGQGPGGLEEYRGVELAAQLANVRGGVDGRRVRLELVPADSADAVPQAMDTLMRRGARVVLGSYGSTMSAVAARVAARRNVVFWETGAVGLLPQVRSGHVFRVPPTGETLGRVAVEFVRDVYLPRAKSTAAIRYGVAYVDDVYGRSVGTGAIDAIRRTGAAPAAFAYDARTANFTSLARRVRQAGVNVLVVGAYLDDGVALRRALVRERVALVANIGTSSSYCMPEFGRRLGADAVGVFASDKPDGDAVPARVLRPDAAAALRWAQRTYRGRFGSEMPAPALAGFAGGWALFHDVLPSAHDTSVSGIVDAARRANAPTGALPNGSGLAFGGNRAGASENLRAASVIWEWVAPTRRAIVWPPGFASRDIAVGLR